MMPGNYHDWLDKIWSDRRAGRIVASLRDYQSRCHEFGVAALSQDGLQEDYTRLCVLNLSDHEAIDFLLLGVAFLRRNLLLQAADHRLQEIAEIVARDSLAAHYQLAFQTGLNQLCRAERTKALEAFVAARSLARNAEEKAYAACNVMLCAEDLGFDYSSLLASLESLLTDQELASRCPDVLHQVYALKARDVFRQADHKALATQLASSPPGDQTDYLLCWCAKLPYFAVVSEQNFIEQRIARLLLRVDEGYMVAYELRTLMGIHHDDDFAESLRPTEQIERLYLWTWRWLIAATPAGLQNVIKLKDHILNSVSGTLSADDYHRLEISLRWLSLFLGLPADQTQFALAAVSAATIKPIPLLAYESMLLAWLFARRDDLESQSQELALAIERHPLHQRLAFQLPQLFTALASNAADLKHFAALFPSLKSLINNESVRNLGLVVYTSSGQIEVLQPDGTVVSYRSRALVQLLFLASKGSSWHAAVVLQTCFDLPVYDEGRHESKLAKLLSQANGFFQPHIRFSRKCAYVFVDLTPGRLILRDANAHTITLMTAKSVFDFMVRCSESKTNGLKVPLSIGSDNANDLSSGWLTRREVEALLGCSRSQAIKRLNEWLTQGLVTRRGVGRACRYQLSAKLQQELAGSLV